MTAGNPRTPGPPTITGIVSSIGSLAVSVSGPTGENGVVSQYRVTATPESGGAEVPTDWPCRPWQMPCTISGLVPGTRYVVSAAAVNAYGPGERTSMSPVLVPAPKPAPPADYPELPDQGICTTGLFVRGVRVAIVNKLGDDIYTDDRLPRRSKPKGRITPGTVGYRCAGSDGNTSLNAPLTLMLDMGFGQVPVLRDGPTGPQNIDTLNANNQVAGRPGIDLLMSDPAQGPRNAGGNLAEGGGFAMAWGGKYAYVTRKPDDSCGQSSMICFEVTYSAIPDGVETGRSYSWDSATKPKPPAPVSR